MKTCTQCGKSFEDNPKFCDNCGALLPEVEKAAEPAKVSPAEPASHVTPAPAPIKPEAQKPAAPAPVRPETQKPAAPAPQKDVYYAKQPDAGSSAKADFSTAPVGLNVISVIGFVLAFLCVAFVWIPEFSIVVFPIALISLVLCTIVKAMKHDNIFAKIGFIVGLVVTIVSGIVFGTYLYGLIV